jgi:wobble nucleotide-excising tRNase
MQFLQSVREQVRRDLEQLATWIEYCSLINKSLVEALQHKRVSLEVESSWDGDMSRVQEGAQILQRLKDHIELHNQQVRNMGAVRREKRAAIERHFAAIHFQEQQLALHERQLATLQRKMRYAANAIQRLERQAQWITAQIDRAARGAERFKELVKFLLRGSELHVESRSEIEFQLMRGTVAADKLSDGEKTAIAFAYFLTSLEGDGENVKDTIVYIDDPISSLDSNHIYAVFGLIQQRLESAHQLFVSTHNSEFFNLIKARWLKDKRLNSHSEVFYVRRLEDSGGAYSQLEALPKLLRRFGSEYQFIFAQLHAFANDPEPTEFQAYAAPNLLRRFLEAYLGFKRPHITEWHAKLDLILDSSDARHELHKLLDDASHLQRMGRALEEPAFIAITRERVRDVLNGLEQKDGDHHSSLVAVISAH